MRDMKPKLVGQFEFVEWTPDSHLRHSRFVALHDDKKPTDVKRGLSQAANDCDREVARLRWLQEQRMLSEL
jgi:ATP-dependent DNA ligase